MSDEAGPAAAGNTDRAGLVAEERAEPAAEPKKSAKLDPETMAIRQKHERPIRIKRGVVIALSGASLLAVGLIAGSSLRHRATDNVAPSSDSSQVAGNTVPDAIRDQPADYSAVPRLGAPLPGDLGKPILERQQQTLVQPVNPVQQRAAEAADAERQQLAAQGRAARESGLLVHSSNDVVNVDPSAATPEIASPGSATAGAVHLALDPDRDPNGQQRKSDFVNATDKADGVDPHRMMPVRSPYTLSAGSVIAASLITGLRSDLPGLVTAQVTENVYDSATGHILLVPQGARLIGSYDSVVAFGQRRALVVWQRIVMPDGSSLTLDNVSATDPAGYSGLNDKVDFHTWQLLKGVVISTLLGVGSQLQFSGQGDLVQAIKQSGQQNVSRAGDQLTSKTLDIQPSITIRPGAAVRLVVHHDLILAPWRG